MKRLVLGIVLSLLLAGMLVPSTLAADETAPAAGTPPAAEPAATQEPTPTPVQGEVVIDPTFIAPTPTPAGVVAGATGRPDITPPPTDTVIAANPSGTSLQVLLVLGVVGSFIAVLIGQVPAARRR